MHTRLEILRLFFPKKGAFGKMVANFLTVKVDDKAYERTVGRKQVKVEETTIAVYYNLLRVQFLYNYYFTNFSLLDLKYFGKKKKWTRVKESFLLFYGITVFTSRESLE